MVSDLLGRYQSALPYAEVFTSLLLAALFQTHSVQDPSFLSICHSLSRIDCTRSANFAREKLACCSSCRPRGWVAREGYHTLVQGSTWYAIFAGGTYLAMLICRRCLGSKLWNTRCKTGKFPGQRSEGCTKTHRM